MKYSSSNWNRTATFEYAVLNKRLKTYDYRTLLTNRPLRQTQSCRVNYDYNNVMYYLLYFAADSHYDVTYANDWRAAGQQ